MPPSATIKASAEEQHGTPPTMKTHGHRETRNPPQVQSMGKTKDGRNLKIRKYPQFETLEEERLYRKQHLAAAFRVFADRGFDEGVAGHISVRDPILTDHFCKSTSAFMTAMLVL
jgi:hypothetical protein